MSSTTSAASGSGTKRTPTDPASLMFSADFDSGNLASVEVDSSACTDTTLAYHLTVNADASADGKDDTYRAWFHFSVAGAQAGDTLLLTLLNLNNQNRLFDQDMRPVYRMTRKAASSDASSSSKSSAKASKTKHIPLTTAWRRLKDPCTYETVDGKLQLTFQHTVTRADATVFFAFAFPYSYAELQSQLEMYDEQYTGHKAIFYHRQRLANTVQGRRVDLLTISSHTHKTSTKEDTISGLADYSNDAGLNPAPCFANKRYVYLSARVHPGETPGSHVLNGFLNLLLDEKDPRAQVLRKHFVFCIIPILNPDGVSVGNYRTDTNGTNLNRCYADPDPALHPSIYALRKSMQAVADRNQLFAFVDFHGHATKRGCFLYGNCLSKNEDQVTNVLFAKLWSLNSAHFEFEGCNFSQNNMTAKDKQAQSKAGTGRVAMYTATGLTHCYTLECNYNKGNFVGALAEGYGQHKDLCPPSPSTCAKTYTIAMYEEVGVGLAMTLLDLVGKNPVSRLHNTQLKSVNGARKWVRTLLKGSRSGKYRGKASSSSSSSSSSSFSSSSSSTSTSSSSSSSSAGASSSSTLSLYAGQSSSSSSRTLANKRTVGSSSWR